MVGVFELVGSEGGARLRVVVGVGVEQGPYGGGSCPRRLSGLKWTGTKFAFEL